MYFFVTLCTPNHKQNQSQEPTAYWMWRRVVGWAVCDFSVDRSAFIFKSQSVQDFVIFLGGGECLTIEDESTTLFRSVGRDSSVSIATRYGLDVPGIESRWGARFSAPVQTGPGTHPAAYTMGTGSFPGVKRPGHGVDQPPH